MKKQSTHLTHGENPIEGTDDLFELLKNKDVSKAEILESEEELETSPLLNNQRPLKVANKKELEKSIEEMLQGKREKARERERQKEIVRMENAEKQ